MSYPGGYPLSEPMLPLGGTFNGGGGGGGGGGGNSGFDAMSLLGLGRSGTQQYPALPGGYSPHSPAARPLAQSAAQFDPSSLVDMEYLLGSTQALAASQHQQQLTMMPLAPLGGANNNDTYSSRQQQQQQQQQQQMRPVAAAAVAPAAVQQPSRPFNPMDMLVAAEADERRRKAQAGQANNSATSYYAASSSLPVASPAPTAATPGLAASTSTSGSGGAAFASAATSGAPAHVNHYDASHTPATYQQMEYLTRTLRCSEAVVHMARNEHVDMEPDMCMVDTQLRDYAGTAIFSYFRFLKFLAIVLLLLFVLALVNYVIFAADQSPSFANRPARLWYTDFFITSYTVKQRDAWMGTTVAGLVLVALGLVVYRQVWVGWYKFDDRDYSLSESEDLHSAAADRVVRYTAEGVIDVSSHYRSKAELVGRRLGSVLVFVGFVAVQVVTSIAITRSGQGTDSVGGAFAIAFIAAALNIAFTMVSRKLTEFEKYETLGAVDRSLVIKLVGFKIANIMAVYGAKRYDAARCVYDVIGEQFMTQLLVEIFFVTPSTVAAAALFTANKQYVASATKSILGDDKHCARFELPVEYLAALYKFLLAAMAMTVFPLSTLLSLAAFFVEFWAARYRLVKLCGKPVRSDASHRTVVVFTMFVIFVAAITTPFAGAAFVLSGSSMLQTNTTRLCNGFPTT